MRQIRQGSRPIFVSLNFIALFNLIFFSTNLSSVIVINFFVDDLGSICTRYSSIQSGRESNECGRRMRALARFSISCASAAIDSSSRCAQTARRCARCCRGFRLLLAKRRQLSKLRTSKWVRFLAAAAVESDALRQDHNRRHDRSLHKIALERADEFASFATREEGRKRCAAGACTRSANDKRAAYAHNRAAHATSRRLDLDAEKSRWRPSTTTTTMMTARTTRTARTARAARATISTAKTPHPLRPSPRHQMASVSGDCCQYEKTLICSGECCLHFNGPRA